jgi:uncharacterized protein YggE
LYPKFKEDIIMKKTFTTVGIALVLVVGLFLGSFSGLTNQASAADSTAVPNSITVSGYDSVIVSPTIADVTIGVTTTNKDVTIAQSDNAKKMDAVYKALYALGIPKDKIKTTSYYINPRYDYLETGTVLVGYDVSNYIQVTVTDLKKISNVIDVTVKQGINQANSITFNITDEQRQALYLKALEKAVANAKSKATALSKAAGVTISKPAQIIENSSSVSVPMPYYDKAMLGAADATSTPITGGEMKVEASITMVYNY